MIIINTGEGKGKTTAAVGQAIRAHGAGLKVSFAQFMKRPIEAGEQKVLAQLLGDEFFAGGRGFYRKKEEYPRHRLAALLVLAWAEARLTGANPPDLLVLDETLYALGSKLLTLPEVLHLVDLAEWRGTHLVLTGRKLPEKLEKRAHLVTEMGEIKHPFAKGVTAQRGIEF